MFTGIVQASGCMKEVRHIGDDMEISIELEDVDMSSVHVGDSVCVNGVCVTVINLSENIMSFDISKETQSCTTFGIIDKNARVNIELAMQLSSRLDGHIVSGHVDTVGKIILIIDEGRSKKFDVEIPEEFSKYVCKKGSISIDGVSLTVNSVKNNIFSVNIIPHTLHQTIFSEYSTGSKVNIEVDLISRYLERLIQNSH